MHAPQPSECTRALCGDLRVDSNLRWGCGARKSTTSPDVEGLYRKQCAVCHEAGVPRAPNRAALAAMDADNIRFALTNGGPTGSATEIEVGIRIPGRESRCGTTHHFWRTSVCGKPGPQSVFPERRDRLHLLGVFAGDLPPGLALQ